MEFKIKRSPIVLRDKKTGRTMKTHGMSKTKIYVLWASMMNRCYQKKLRDYHRWGGRGIRVCKRWHKFENFFKDMGHRPPRRTLDRKNNNKNYSPGNCRWVTQREQHANRRDTVYVILKGEKICVSEASRRIKVPRSIVYKAIRDHGAIDLHDLKLKRLRAARGSLMEKK